jgi:hypothetical protein
MDDSPEDEVHKKKLQKMQALQDILHDCEMNEPALSLGEIAMVLSWEVKDMTKFLEEYNREKKLNI